MDGLQQVVTVRSSLISTLVPKLVGAGALSLASVKSLGRLASVPEVSLDLYLTSVIPGMLKAFDKVDSVGETDELLEHAEALLVGLSFATEDSDAVVNELLKGLKFTLQYTPSDTVRINTAQLTMALYVEGVELADECHTDIMEELVKLLDHENQEVRLAVWNAISTIVKTLGPKGADFALNRFLPVLRSGIQRLKEKGQRKEPEDGGGADWFLAGLQVPKGLDPFVEVYQRALLKGSEELRESGAIGLGELIQVAPLDVLIKKIVVITGPLIRVFGDKFNWQVKAAILTTFGILIAKAGAKIKQFVPQLQGIFTKALRSGSSPVRKRAIFALEKLLPLFPANKFDPLVKDLHKGIKEGGADSDDPVGVVEALLKATKSVLSSAGGKVSAETMGLLTPTVVANLFHDEGALLLQLPMHMDCPSVCCRW